MIITEKEIQNIKTCLHDGGIFANVFYITGGIHASKAIKIDFTYYLRRRSLIDALSIMLVRTPKRHFENKILP